MKFEYYIPDDQVERVFLAFCGTYGYQATVKNEEGSDIPNPVSPAAFTLQCYHNHTNVVVDGWDAELARIKAEEERAKRKAEDGDPGVQITVIG